MAAKPGDQPSKMSLRVGSLEERVDALDRRVAAELDAMRTAASASPLGDRDLGDEIEALREQIASIEAHVEELSHVMRRAVLTGPKPLTADQVESAVADRPRARFRCLRDYPPANLRANDQFVPIDRFTNINVFLSHVRGELRVAAA